MTYEYIKKCLEAGDEFTITITLDGWTCVDCVVDSVFSVEDKHYIALLSIDVPDQDIFIYRIKVSETEEIELENIDDDEEFNKAAEAYDALLDEEIDYVEDIVNTLDALVDEE